MSSNCIFWAATGTAPFSSMTARLVLLLAVVALASAFSKPRPFKGLKGISNPRKLQLKRRHLDETHRIISDFRKANVLVASALHGRISSTAVKQHFPEDKKRTAPAFIHSLGLHARHLDEARRILGRSSKHRTGKEALHAYVRETMKAGDALKRQQDAIRKSHSLNKNAMKSLGKAFAARARKGLKAGRREL